MSLKVTFYVISHLLMVVTCETDANGDELLSDDTPNLELPGGFLDPHSFHYDRAKKIMIDKPDETDNRPRTVGDDHRYEPERCRDTNGNSKLDYIFTRRLVNLLLSNAAFKEKDDVIEGNVFLYAKSSQIEMLKQFGDGKVSVRQVDSILSDVIRPPPIDILMEAITLTESIVATFYQHSRLCVAVLAALFVFIIIVRMRWTTGKVILAFLAIVFLTSFLITMWRHIKEAEIKHMATAMKYKDIPIQCQPDKMNLWHRFMAYYGGEDECEKYYSSVMMDPILQVTPTNALLHVLTKTVLDPLVLSGEAIGDFIEKVTANLWFPMRWLITPMMYVVVMLIMLVMPLCLFGGSIGFGPFFRISLGRERAIPARQQPNISEERQPITVILKVTHEGSVNRIEPKRMEPSVQQNSLALAGGDHQSQNEGPSKEIGGPESDASGGEVNLQVVQFPRLPSVGIELLEDKNKENEEIGGGDS